MVDLVIVHAGELLTLAGGGPRCGDAMRDIGIVRDGAVGIADGRIACVGPSQEVLKQAGPATRTIDAAGRVVMPGFVDAHTHLVFAGDRAGEFEQRLRGATYLEIMAAGGGIVSTVEATRRASQAELAAAARRRLAAMRAQGTTTVEAKTGYGLDLPSEMRMLAVAAELNKTQPAHIVPTFMPAHATPPEYADHSDGYVDLVVNTLLPAAARSGSVPRFCDVFCDEGAFTLEQSRRVLQAAKSLGMGLKIHADEFAHLGGARLAAELGAVSAEHLAVTPREDMEAMAAAGVIAVLLPGTTFGLASSHYADARTMIGCGLAVALGTDLNPGTCYCTSMPFMIALACRYLKMTPAEAICAATLNAAHASGAGDVAGSIEPGKRADIIILDTADYRHLAYQFGGNLVANVIMAGQEITHGLA